MDILETTHNWDLIENGLVHVEFEFTRKQPSLFRVARESDLLLYRSMVEALKGSANIEVTNRPSKNQTFYYRQGGALWKEIHRIAVERCTRAWRFSEPVDCNPPKINPPSKSRDPGLNDYLLSFYYALAKIQSPCFMNQFVMSKPVVVSDDEMAMLEWLHDAIRNEYEHFVPKSYSAPSVELMNAAALSIRIAHEALFESRNAIPDPDFKDLVPRMKCILERIELYVQREVS